MYKHINVLYVSVQVRFSAFRVVNVLAVCSMPFAVHLIDFTKNNRPIARYILHITTAVITLIKIMTFISMQTFLTSVVFANNSLY